MWLDDKACKLIQSSFAVSRRAALAAVEVDTTLAEAAAQAIEESGLDACTMTSQALSLLRTPCGRHQLAVRSLLTPIATKAASATGETPGGGGVHLRSAAYASLFEVLFPRLASERLSLLPHPRLCFDLAPYCATSRCHVLLGASGVANLIRAGSTLISSAISPQLAEQMVVELGPMLGHCTSCDRSTTRSHVRTTMLLSSEAPPGAPEPPPPSDPPPPHLYGTALRLDSAAMPATATAVRELRGLGASLEAVSDMRLALPRAAFLLEWGEGGCETSAPPNDGWPDTGCEVCAHLFLGASPTGAAHAARAAPTPTRGVDVVMGSERRQVSPAVGDVLLTLARQVRCDVPPQELCGEQAGMRRCLTFYMYSAWQRSKHGTKVLGASAEVSRRLNQ